MWYNHRMELARNSTSRARRYALLDKNGRWLEVKVEATEKAFDLLYALIKAHNDKVERMQR